MAGVGIGLRPPHRRRSAAEAPPVLALSSGSITVTTSGYPAPPHLTNNNGTITAEAA